MQNHPKHDEDFYGWAINTAALLKQKNFNALDLDSLIEELEDMGKREKRGFVSRISQLTAHLLKWQFQSGLRSNSWRYTIKEQREQLLEILADNPSFKLSLNDFLEKGYKHSINIFKSDTNLEIDLPDLCPYTFEQLLDQQFYPEKLN